MIKINVDFLTGNENKIYWIDDKNSIYFFYDNMTFVIQNEDSSVINGTYLINDEKLIILDINEDSQKYLTIIKDNNDNYIFQEFKKEIKDNKKVLKIYKTNKAILCDYPTEVEEKENKEKMKEIFDKYNYINYLVIFSLFIVYIFIILVIFKFLPIVSNFPFLFNFLIILGLSSFIHKPLFLIFHKISILVRNYLDK